MKLAAYLKQEKIGIPAFALRIGVSNETVRLYVGGAIGLSAAERKEISKQPPAQADSALAGVGRPSATVAPLKTEMMFLAYKLRWEGLLWREVAERVSGGKKERAIEWARRYAKAHALPWPIDLQNGKPPKLDPPTQPKKPPALPPYPSPEVMARIVDATGGLVGPDDFRQKRTTKPGYKRQYKKVPCQYCEKLFRPRGHPHQHCSNPCKFMSKVEKQENGCWLWTGNASAARHGTFFVHRPGKPHISVLAPWYAFCGFRVKRPRKPLIHTCGETRCVNPEHLEKAA